VNKEEILKIKSDTRTNDEIAAEYKVSVSTIFHIKHGAENRMLYSARDRAKENSLEFNITIEDIVIPDKCPLLGIVLESHIGTGAKCGHLNSPTLDRKDPTIGYVKGNVWVISKMANQAKNSCTFEQFEKLYRNWKAALNPKNSM
jgi:hypothetical protein